MRKKIVQIISNLGMGGAERQLLDLCKGLENSGFQVAVGSIKSGGDLMGAFREASIEVKEFGMEGSINPRAFSEARNWLHLQHPDLVHTHLFKGDVYGTLAAKSAGIPLVSTKHNEDEFLFNPFYARIAAYCAAKATALVFVSEAVRRFYLQNIAMEHPVTRVIPLGIKLSGLGRKNRQEALVIGMVGRLNKQKGHEIGIRAFRRIRDAMPGIRMRIFGAGPEENRLRKLVRDLELHDSVTFCGVLFDQNEIYDQIDLLCFPSLWEGAGLVLLEAMSRGIPVVASETGGIPELVTAGCGLLIPPNDEHALSSAILNILANSSLLERLSAAGQERARSFLFDNTLQAHINLYNELL